MNHSPAPRRSIARDLLLLLLACAGGAVDAAAYVGIGRVFTANMTGNTVLLGIALGSNERTNMLLAAATLSGFALGVLVGTWFSGTNQGGAWTRRLTATLALEWLVLVGVLVGWHAAGDPHTFLMTQLALLGTTAFAMGMQSAVVRKLSITGVATTYLSGTITTLMARFAERYTPLTSRAPADNPGEKRLLLAVWLVYVAGAASAAILINWAQSWTLALPLTLIAVVVVGSVVFQKRANTAQE